MSILLFIFILTLLILVHELGHFIAAKRAGVRVDEFGIGFPPRLFSKKVGETVYSINLFPVGGFVKIFGEDPNADSLEGKDSLRSLTNTPRIIQAWIITAGVIFNLLFAWILISAGFMVGLPYSTVDSKYSALVVNPELTIVNVIPHSPAETAGLSSGDVITKFVAGGETLVNPTIAAGQNFISSHETVEVTYRRGTELHSVQVKAAEGFVSSGKRAIGVSLDFIGTLTLPVHKALAEGFITTARVTEGMTFGIINFFKNIFIGQGSLEGIAGPVGIVGIVKSAAHLGWVSVLSLTAIISINLAIINLLPFPALDGGRLLFLIIESIKRSPIQPSVVNALNAIGFLVLIGFMVFVTFHDVVKLIHG